MFPYTNNATEYEALLHGLRMAKEMNLSRVRSFGDLDLVAQQVSGTGDSKDPLMAAYHREVDTMLVISKVIKWSMLITGKMKLLML